MSRRILITMAIVDLLGSTTILGVAIWSFTSGNLLTAMYSVFALVIWLMLSYTGTQWAKNQNRLRNSKKW